MKTKITFKWLLLIGLFLIGFHSTIAQQRIAALQEPFVILIDPADGSIVDPQFIDLTPQSQGLPKAIIQVDDELWISDQTEDQIYRYDLTGTFISTITGALDNIKGMAYVNNSEVWVTNAGSNNGAPGTAILRFDTDGNSLGFFPTTGSSFDIIDTGTEVYVSYIGTDTRIERRDYAGTVLGNIVDPGVVTFMQQMEVNTTSNSIFTGVFSNNPPNGPGLYEFSITDGAILNYYDIGALRGVAQLDDGNVLFSTGNNINLLNTTTSGTTLVSAGGGSHYFGSIDFMPCTTPATPTGDAVQTFNEGATVADLVADPTDVTWFATEFDAMNNVNPLAGSTLLEDGEDYFAVSIDGACISDVLEVLVEIICTPPATPTGDAVQTFMEGATVSDIVVNPTAVTWYPTEMDAVNNTNPLDPTTLLEDGEDYFAVNIVNDCSSDPLEVTIIIETLGVTDFSNATISMYPNPVRNEVSITYIAEMDTVTITNTLGQVVLEKNINRATVQLDVSGLSNGLYIISVSAGNKVMTGKLIKE